VATLCVCAAVGYAGSCKPEENTPEAGKGTNAKPIEKGGKIQLTKEAAEALGLTWDEKGTYLELNDENIKKFKGEGGAAKTKKVRNWEKDEEKDLDVDGVYDLYKAVCAKFAAYVDALEAADATILTAVAGTGALKAGRTTCTALNQILSSTAAVATSGSVAGVAIVTGTTGWLFKTTGNVIGLNNGTNGVPAYCTLVKAIFTPLVAVEGQVTAAVLAEMKKVK